jgi:hypothetical protein
VRSQSFFVVHKNLRGLHSLSSGYESSTVPRYLSRGVRGWLVNLLIEEELLHHRLADVAMDHGNE